MIFSERDIAMELWSWRKPSTCLWGIHLINNVIVRLRFLFHVTKGMSLVSNGVIRFWSAPSACNGTIRIPFKWEVIIHLGNMQCDNSPVADPPYL
jgi:hypothetical protein